MTFQDQLHHLLHAVINWISKKQPKIESSLFGVKFVAMKKGMEKLQGLQDMDDGVTPNWAILHLHFLPDSGCKSLICDFT